MHQLRSRRSLATLLVLASGTGTALAQCDIVDDDFNGVPLGTPLDALPGWSDLITGTDTRVGRAPGATSPSIWVQSSLARRDLLPLQLPDQYQVRFSATVYGRAAFRVVCPTIVIGMAWFEDTRLGLVFDADSAHSTVLSLDTGASVPIQRGVPFDVFLDIDTTSGATIHVDGVSLGYVPWPQTPGPCTAPDGLFWECGFAANAGMYVDDVCVGTIGTAVGCDAQANSTGVAATLSGPAVARVSQASILLEARQLPPSSAALVLLARTTNPPVPLASGRLCLGPPVARVLDSLTSSNSSGIATHVFSLTEPLPHPYSTVLSPAFILAGETWAFQAYFRDVAASPSANLTPAITVAFVP